MILSHGLVGDCVGLGETAAVGDKVVGTLVVGNFVGLFVVGNLEGDREGLFVGLLVGFFVGTPVVGNFEGLIVGFVVGCADPEVGFGVNRLVQVAVATIQTQYVAGRPNALQVVVVRY